MSKPLRFFVKHKHVSVDSLVAPIDPVEERVDDLDRSRGTTTSGPSSTMRRAGNSDDPIASAAAPTLR